VNGMFLKIPRASFFFMIKLEKRHCPVVGKNLVTSENESERKSKYKFIEK